MREHLAAVTNFTHLEKKSSLAGLKRDCSGEQ